VGSSRRRLDDSFRQLEQRQTEASRAADRAARAQIGTARDSEKRTRQNDKLDKALDRAQDTRRDSLRGAIGRIGAGAVGAAGAGLGAVRAQVERAGTEELERAIFALVDALTGGRVQTFIDATAASTQAEAAVGGIAARAAAAGRPLSEDALKRLGGIASARFEREASAKAEVKSLLFPNRARMSLESVIGEDVMRAFRYLNGFVGGGQ